MTNKQNITYKG